MTVPCSSSDMRHNVANNPCVSYWMKDAVIAMSRRDCLDALYDAEMLLEYTRQVCRENGLEHVIDNMPPHRVVEMTHV